MSLAVGALEDSAADAITRKRHPVRKPDNERHIAPAVERGAQDDDSGLSELDRRLLRLLVGEDPGPPGGRREPARHS